MRSAVERSNQGLLADLRALQKALLTAAIPPEVVPYRDRVVLVCQWQEQGVIQNLQHLALELDELLVDIASATTQIIDWYQLLTTRLVVPVLRATMADRVCLKIIGWMHGTHPKTSAFPPIFLNGGVAIWPFLATAPIYFFPCISERGLLCQPLLFHEFGHLLYQLHKPEMDALVGDLQRHISDSLSPASQRNDRYADREANRRQIIVDVWYSWAQELFCDAVGLQIGGPSFLEAFSAYLTSLGQGDFYWAEIDLRESAHPVNWLRVQLLVRRAMNKGYTDLAARVGAEWQSIASSLGILEDYHGFYDCALDASILGTVEDMLTEVDPRTCTPDEAEGNGWTPGVDSPIRLLNWAWRIRRTTPTEYATWEGACIADFLG